MKKNYIILSLLSILAFSITSCDFSNDSSSSSTDSTYTITLIGSVVDATTGNPISSAVLRITDGSSVYGATTSTDGSFTAEIESSEDLDLTVIATKDGYVSDTTTVLAITDETTTVPMFQLDEDEDSSVGSDPVTGAASINLASQSAPSIGVKESGAIESAEIVFEVRDSSGALINEDNAIDLNFMFGATVNGGEYLYPASATTNALGRATVTLNTGTIAGVVQVIAEASVNGKTIRSKPVLIAIHGGFPTQDVFYVACEKLNYPALGVVGFSIPFTAYAGDKYNNPVRPGTSIYFTTNYGIIGGSSLTDDAGTATSNLLTEPWPDDEVYGPGFFTVTAKTVDEFQNNISTSTVRLLSGTPLISVTPSSFNIANGGSQTFTYTIADVNGNPMSEGQSVTIKIDSEFYEVVGTTEVKFPDTQSKSYTSFSFMAYDTEPDSLNVEQIGIEIKSSGPNGESTIGFSGTGQ